MKNMIYIITSFVAIIALWSLWGFLWSNVEQPNYTVVKKMNSYEIRQYPEHIIAQTTVQGSFKQSLNNGFRILAGYIFGWNTKKESIAMTAPVVAQQNGKTNKSESISMTAPVIATTQGDSQIISFNMPRSYTLETLPIPTDPRVKIITIPSEKYAVMRFFWYNSDTKIKNMQKKLLSALAEDGIATQGNISYAWYNAPLTPPRMTRNEVLIELKDTMSKKIVLAGGCFWGIEELIRKQPGVINTTVGYNGGKIKNPTYENHKSHAEAVEIEYDTQKTSYKKLLDFFFQIHNPTTLNSQGNDIGSSYRSAIFYGNEEEKEEAKNFIEIVNKSKRWKDQVVTTLEPLETFYPAEEYHQDYLQKNPDGYTCHVVYFDSYIK